MCQSTMTSRGLSCCLPAEWETACSFTVYTNQYIITLKEIDILRIQHLPTTNWHKQQYSFRCFILVSVMYAKTGEAKKREAHIVKSAQVKYLFTMKYLMYFRSSWLGYVLSSWFVTKPDELP